MMAMAAFCSAVCFVKTWGICTRRAGKLYKARSRLYRSQILQVNTRWKALAEIYTMHSFAPFWNRIPKNEENHGGEKILVQSRENRPGEAHRQLQLTTQCYPRARSRIKAVWQAREYTWDTTTIPGFRLVELTANRMSFVRISCEAKLIDKVPRSLYKVQGCCVVWRNETHERVGKGSQPT